MIVRFIVLTFLFIFCKTVLLYVNHLFPDQTALLPVYYAGDLIFAAVLSLPGKRMQKAAVFACAVTTVLYALNTAFFSYLHDWIRLPDLIVLKDTQILLSSTKDPMLISSFLYGFLICVAGLLSFIFLKRTNKCEKCGANLPLTLSVLALFIVASIAIYPLKPLSNNPAIAFLSSRDSNIMFKDGLCENSAGSVEPEAEDENTHLSSKPFNVILISMESVGNVSRYHAGESMMPYFEKLTDQGVYFENGYAPYPLTMKSLFSVFTGQYPSADQRVIGELNPDINIQTLSEYVHEIKYRTAMIHGSYFRYQLKSEFFKKRGFDVMIDADQLKSEYDLINSWGVSDTAVYQQALNWIAGEDRPFFLTLLPLFAHHPYDSPENSASKLKFEPMIERYHKALQHRDEELKYFIESLRSMNVLSDTLIVVFGDHGEAFMQHDRNIAHTGFLYDENIRVPILYYFEGRLKPRRINDPVSLTSVHEVILKMFEIPESGWAQNIDTYFSQFPHDLIYFHTSVGRDVSGLRDGKYKYIYEFQSNSDELYDLSEDPSEKVNVAAVHSERVSEYRRAVKSHRSSTIRAIDRKRS